MLRSAERPGIPVPTITVPMRRFPGRSIPSEKDPPRTQKPTLRTPRSSAKNLRNASLSAAVMPGFWIAVLTFGYLSVKAEETASRYL